MPRPLISIIHSSARPAQWWDTCFQWFDLCDKPDEVEYCLCYEPGKGDYRLGSHPWKNFVSAPTKGRPCLVDGWNTAAALSTGSLIVGIADDLLPGPHWDAKLIEAMSPEILGREAFIWPSTNSASDSEICIHPILTRARYDRFGYWFYPGYWAVFCDNENWDLARRDGVIYDVRDKVLLDHRHTTSNKRVGDSVDTGNLSRWGADEALYKRRKATGFPPLERV